jgi:hypothetical protein
VAIEIEIDPGLGAARLWATQQISMESPRGGEVMDGEREVERSHTDAVHFLLRIARVIQGAYGEA